MKFQIEVSVPDSVVVHMRKHAKSILKRPLTESELLIFVERNTHNNNYQQLINGYYEYELDDYLMAIVK